MNSALLETLNIVDWSSFHDQCIEVFGFPSFYGRNINALIDCLSYLTDNDGMTRFVLANDEQLVITIKDFVAFSANTPEICSAFLEAIAFVNQRYLSSGEIARLALVLA